jgi:hypothetical protein
MRWARRTERRSLEFDPLGELYPSMWLRAPEYEISGLVSKLVEKIACHFAE